MTIQDTREEMFGWELVHDTASDYAANGTILFDRDALCEFSALVIDLEWSGWIPMGIKQNGLGGMTIGSMNRTGSRLDLAVNHRGLCSAYAFISPEWPMSSRRYVSNSLLHRIIRSKYWSFS